MRNPKPLRRRFLLELWRGLGIVWPVISALLVLMALLGLAVGHLEGWPWSDSLYFSFVTGLTVGYGDLAPKLAWARGLAMVIGLSGIVLTGIVVAVAVEALRVALDSEQAAQ
ncbi:potassium channel family protein [Variovorax sp. OV329]|uniref:potassium channel family protein n=1 Tax=Variovorax sp. OV329 TaxID=1882825 RepID=UPI0008EB17D7|nr:potassium channel family protein [Variovorax sp. OV329]SFM04163.1 Ion channel [Variovorax sp. OV329]